ncbi:MAG: hypothetical protein NUW06_00055 [Candidatus Acetothermia bacterium]|jgi:hypothetical protein|nr:hypothetical protein [Candidatus Acetothermia bacterium]MDH7504906.1 hypothetical protein [Candidatus Acetothermia bacterium]
MCTNCGCGELRKKPRKEEEICEGCGKPYDECECEEEEEEEEEEF